MKLQNIYKLFFPALLVGVISTGIVSCEKSNDWEIDESTNRLFRPTQLEATVDGVTAIIRWKNMPNTDAYTIELSKDSLQFTQIVKTYKGAASKDANGYYFVIPELLDAQTQYSARIKGTDTIGIPESQWAAVAFKTKTEQIMTAVTDADLTAMSVVLKWKAGSAVSHFTIGTTRYDITADERAAGAKTITGLTPETTYDATLYLETKIRGTQKFTTLPNLPTGANVVLVKATDDLATMITTVANGTMFVLRKGTVYTTDNAITIPEGVSFTIWGEPGGVKPVIAFNGLTLPATAGTIRFENLDITGYQAGDATKTKRNYIFNQSTASNTSEIVFENCTIRNLVNSPMRLQGSAAITVDKFTVNKCLVYDIGDNASNGTYAFVHNSIATGKINNITVTNSTFYKIGYAFILHSAAPSVTVAVRNNTFNNVTGNGRIFIDYNAQAVTSSFIFENNIVGKTLSPAASAKAIRSATVPTVINSYQTTDAVFTGNLIPNVTAYNKASTDLFTNPDGGDFIIKDNSFAGKDNAGDPRWR